MDQPPPSPQNLPEKEFAAAIGMARDDLKKMRAELLAPSTDWSGGGGLPVVIHPSGQALIIAHLQKNAPEKKEGAAGDGDPLSQAVAAASSASRWVSLVVYRVSKNKRLLEARAKGDSTTTLTVQVRDTSLFKAGMALDRCEPSSTPNFFYYQGRQPRARGRF